MPVPVPRMGAGKTSGVYAYLYHIVSGLIQDTKWTAVNNLQYAIHDILEKCFEASECKLKVGV